MTLFLGPEKLLDQQTLYRKVIITLLNTQPGLAGGNRGQSAPLMGLISRLPPFSPPVYGDGGGGGA